jgi:hypothetical protein
MQARPCRRRVVQALFCFWPMQARPCRRRVVQALFCFLPMQARPCRRRGSLRAYVSGNKKKELVCHMSLNRHTVVQLFLLLYKSMCLIGP